jgi:hypothetical protein
MPTLRPVQHKLVPVEIGTKEDRDAH